MCIRDRVIVARHMDIRVFGISIVTDSGVPGEIVEISHEEVQEVAMKACLLYTSPSPRDRTRSRMPSSA